MYFCLFQKEKVTQIIVVLSFIFALLKFYYCMLHIEIYLSFFICYMLILIFKKTTTTKNSTYNL